MDQEDFEQQVHPELFRIGSGIEDVVEHHQVLLAHEAIRATVKPFYATIEHHNPQLAEELTSCLDPNGHVASIILDAKGKYHLKSAQRWICFWFDAELQQALSQAILSRLDYSILRDATVAKMSDSETIARLAGMISTVYSWRFLPVAINQTLLPARKEAIRKFVSNDNVPRSLDEFGAGLALTTLRYQLTEQLDIGPVDSLEIEEAIRMSDDPRLAIFQKAASCHQVMQALAALPTASKPELNK